MVKSLGKAANTRFNAKTVLISGGTSGIGKAAVIELLKNGFNVSTFSTNKGKCDLLEKEQNKFRSKLFVQYGDVKQEKDLKRIVDSTLKRFGSIDILINNAGYGYFVESDKVDFKKFEDMLQVNLIGLSRLVSLVVPHMKKKKEGLIINIASTAGKTSYPLGEFYSSTKFAVMGYSEGLRKELKEYGIKVSTICPGMIKTNFFKKEEIERRTKLNDGKSPVMLQVEDISRIIVFICAQSDNCDIQDLAVMPF